MQALITDAGYTPQNIAPPPGLAGGGSRDSDAEVDEKQAALKELLQADPVQQQLLCKIGFSPPPVKKPSIMELLQKDLDNLPVKQPEGPVTPQSAIASAAKAYKSAAVELKDLMVQQGRIQDKINKSKAALEALYREMQTLTQRIQSQQQAVSEQLQALQDLTPAEQPATRHIDFDLCKVLRSLGVSLNEEQDPVPANRQPQETGLEGPKP